MECSRPGGAHYCTVNGAIAPVDKAANARPINFQVALPSTWNGRSVQLGGGGMNGTIPGLAGSQLGQGYVTYGSDSGHQAGGFGGGRPAGLVAPEAPVALVQPGGLQDPTPNDDWGLNDEAIKNLGYMQMKKTHDAAMVLIDRMYGAKPKYNYYVGSSQGGREALTVAQRYPADYDGVAANVPIVNFSSLMLSPELHRIQEKAGDQLGDDCEGQRDSRRVHAPVRQAGWSGGRHHEQLRGVPRDLRREAGSEEPPSLGRETLSR